MASMEFKNTFAQGVAGDTISMSAVIGGIRYGTIKEESLPREVHDAVAAEIERRERKMISPSRALLLLLGTMGDIRGKTRIQKYAFLTDMNIYSKKTSAKYTMYGWKPHKYGPYSASLDQHVHEAVECGLVEEFAIPAPDGKAGAGYRLTDRGKAEFLELLGSFEEQTKVTKSLLAEFAHDKTVDHLVESVYSQYPEFTVKSTILDRVRQQKG